MASHGVPAASNAKRPDEPTYTTPLATAGDEDTPALVVPVQFNTMLDWTASLLMDVSGLNPVRAGPRTKHEPVEIAGNRRQHQRDKQNEE
jgi:hypothetical protein